MGFVLLSSSSAPLGLWLLECEFSPCEMLTLITTEPGTGMGNEETFEREFGRSPKL